MDRYVGGGVIEALEVSSGHCVISMPSHIHFCYVHFLFDVYVFNS